MEILLDEILILSHTLFVLITEEEEETFPQSYDI